MIGPIARDVSMGGVVTEEQEISCDQYLDLVYSQIGTLYDLIPDAPRPSTNPYPTHPVASHVVDGVIGAFYVETQSTQDSHTNPKSITSNVHNTPTPTPSPSKNFEVNLVQSTLTGKNQNKKKGKGKNKEDKNIINNMINPKYILLMKKISVNLVILALSIVRIITRNIVHDVLTLLSSCKGPKNLLHLSSCHNVFILNSRPN
jgi:hypothetical protein